MNAGQLLSLVKDVVALLESSAVLLPSGEFDATKLDTIAEDVAFAQAVEGVLKKHGLAVSDRVDKVLQILPLLAAIIK